MVTTVGIPTNLGEIEAEVEVAKITDAWGGALGPKNESTGWTTSPRAGRPSSGPLLGDFGSGLTEKNGLFAVLPQLPGNLSSAFAVQLGCWRSGPALALGLTRAIRSRVTSWVPMQGARQFPPFPHSNRPTYAQALLAGEFLLRRGGITYALLTDALLDTGAPTTNIHEDDTVNPGPLTGSIPGFNKIDVKRGSGELGVNLGLIPFFRHDVVFDVERGLVGFAPRCADPAPVGWSASRGCCNLTGPTPPSYTRRRGGRVSDFTSANRRPGAAADGAGSGRSRLVPGAVCLRRQPHRSPAMPRRMKRGPAYPPSLSGICRPLLQRPGRRRVPGGPHGRAGRARRRPAGRTSRRAAPPPGSRTITSRSRSPVPLPSEFETTGVAAQIANALAGPAFNPSRTLFLVWAGPNDIFLALDTGTDPSEMPAAIAQAVANLASDVEALAGAGARYILVPNMADLGATPFAASKDAENAGFRAFLSGVTEAFNAALASAMSALEHRLRDDRVHIAVFDTFAVQRLIVATATALRLHRHDVALPGPSRGVARLQGIRVLRRGPRRQPPPIASSERFFAASCVHFGKSCFRSVGRGPDVP